MSFASEKEIEELEKSFPEDPTQPSVSVASSDKGQIVLPWAKAADGHLIATLGKGCHSAKLESSSETAPFQTESAFSSSTMEKRLWFRNGPGTESSFRKAMTADVTSHSEHLSMSANVSAGCKFAGVSGSGKFNASVTKSSDNMKASVQSTVRTGAIYLDYPQLSPDAITEARQSRRDPSTFTRKYGDYYVAVLHLGADTGVLASTSTAGLSETQSIEVKAKLHLLWWDIEANYRDDSHSEEQWSALNINAFDTLTESNVTPSRQGNSQQGTSKKLALDYIQRASDLEERARQKMEEIGLVENKKLEEADVKKVCESGLVVGIGLLPYSHLRDYMRALTERV